MKKRSSIFLQLLLLAFLCFGGTVTAQPPGTVSPTVTQNGYSLQKSTSLSSVNTGDIFTYTITFSIPGGATSVNIGDLVPAPLVIDNVVTPVGGYSGNIPVVTNAANFVNLFFASVGASISGSFQINVHFPVDKSCNGTRASNAATLSGKTPDCNIKTEGITTTAVVNNPWRVRKYATAQYVGGSCPYAVVSDTVEYTVQIVKQVWTLSGSASLYNVALFDIMPAGASVIPGTYTTSANLSASTINTSTGVINLPVGFSLDATGNNYYWAKFKLAFSIPVDTLPNCTVNKVVLQGTYNCNGTPSAPSYADTFAFRIHKVKPAPVGLLQKWYSVTGNVPGCTGSYFVRVCNTGTAPLPVYTLKDTFPACLTGVTFTPPPGCTITGGPLIYTLSSSVPLLPGQCETYTFNFTIGTTCTSPITNKVVATSGFTAGPVSSSIALLPEGGKPCLTKSICGPSTYTIGSIVRFRLRIQNIGDDPLTGTNIKDNLDNGNLAYVGNELYYYYPNPFAPCAPNNTTPPAGATPWLGVTTSHNIPLGQLTWNLPTIGVECGNVSYPACGYAYGLKAYYIEFSVKIKDTAGLGNLQNIATISGGNIVTPLSTTVSFVVNGNLNYNVSKEVSADGGATFSNAVTANPGALVQFKLKSLNTGIPLVTPLLMDLLPRDNNTGAPVDNFIMSPASRGSVYDIRYNSYISSTHTIAASGQWFSFVDGIKTTPELNYTVNANGPGWAPTPSLNAVNLKTYLSQSIGLSPSLAYVFDARTSASATDGQVACNSFVLRPYAKYIINYATSYVLQPTSADALPACVTIVKKPCCDPYQFNIPDVVCLGVDQQFCVKDSCPEPGNLYTWNFGDGSPTVNGSCVNHTYTAAGVYHLTVYWRNDCGEFKKEFIITVKECPCCEPYAYEVPKQVCLNIAQQFCVKDSCIGNGNVYNWKFGDGTPVVTGNCVSHAYTTPGTYVVVVFWHNNCGDFQKEFVVEVKDCPCDINVCYKVVTNGLSITADAGCTTSTLPIVLYVWDFGDGTFGTGQVVTHTYATPGTYVVTLTVHAMEQNGDVCKCVKDCRTEVWVDEDRKYKYDCGTPQLHDPKTAMASLNNSNIVLKASPNPFTDKLSVSINFINKAKAGDRSGYVVEISNMNGTALQTKRLPDFEKNPVFYTTGYPSGSYFVMLKNGSGQVQSVKVVKIN